MSAATGVVTSQATSHGAPASAGDAVASDARPLRIAQVVPAMDTGGMEVMVLGLSVALRRHGHDARIICTESLGGMADRVRDSGVPLELVPAQGLSSLVAPGALTARFRSGRMDVVHSHSGVCAKASRAAHAARVPAILHTRHGIQLPFSRSDRFFLWLGAVQTDVTAGCSVDVVKYYRQMLPRRDGIVLVENGIDDAALHRVRPGDGALRDELGVPHDALVMGTVARLHAVKNQQLMIRALAELDDRWHLVLVGDGALREALAAQAAAAGLTGRVHFAGQRAISAALYASFDVFVLSSLSEAMPMTVLEAFASRVPVVASAVGGLPAVLDGGRLGRLFPGGDATALAAAVRETVRDADGTAAQVERAALRLAERHTVEAMTLAYESLYRGCLAAARR
ncbi:MAG: glycosyltransferase [Gemmatimonadaceae bacterium]|nr:glycosyltransferase [Gemmatimonadaceae bacterium]